MGILQSNAGYCLLFGFCLITTSGEQGMFNNWNNLDGMDLTNRRVLTRVDFNVPMQDGRITDNTRIVRTVPTIKKIQEKRGVPVLITHLGRPKSKRDKKYSLAPLISTIEKLTDSKVIFSPETTGSKAKETIEKAKSENIVLLENIRFDVREQSNDLEFAASLANLGDIYCNDAFSASHRAHASIEGLARLIPTCVGLLMEAELRTLTTALEQPKRPLMSMVGGAKTSTKINLLTNLIRKSDILVVGGSMANTFLSAQKISVGKSLIEPEMEDTALKIISAAEKNKCELILPTDYVVAKELKSGIDTLTVTDCPEEMMILDIGRQTINRIQNRMHQCRTMIWNGPLGAFEYQPFDESTILLANSAVKFTQNNTLMSVAGGGDTTAALISAKALDQFSYVSTAGGAFLEWMEGKELPGIAVLRKDS